jgi:hypothetical protein
MKEKLVDLLDDKDHIINKITKKANLKNDMYGDHESTPNYKAQIDLIEIVNNNGFKYILIVVDVHTRKIDMIPLKNKTSADVLQAYYKILKNGIIKKTKYLYADGGNEFKGVFEKSLKDIKIIHSIKYLGIVDNKIGFVSRILAKIMLKQKIQGDPVNWFDYLDDTRDYVNKKFSKNRINIDKLRKVKKFNINKVDIDIKATIKKDEKKIELLNIGDRVRFYLKKHPYDLENDKYYSNNRFREGDIRWSPMIYTIEQLILRPTKPVYYKLKTLKDNLFMRHELLLVNSIDEKYNKITHKKKHDKMIREYLKVKSNVEILIKLFNNNYKNENYIKNPKFDLIRDIIKLNQKITTADRDKLLETIKQQHEDKYDLKFTQT